MHGSSRKITCADSHAQSKSLGRKRKIGWGLTCTVSPSTLRSSEPSSARPHCSWWPTLSHSRQLRQSDQTQIQIPGHQIHEFLCLTGNTRSMITRLSWKGTSYHCVWPQIVVDRERANVVRMSTLQVFQQAERPHGFKDFIASRANQPVLHTHCPNMRTSTLPFTAILAKLLKRIRMMTITI